MNSSLAFHLSYTSTFTNNSKPKVNNNNTKNKSVIVKRIQVESILKVCIIPESYWSSKTRRAVWIYHVSL